MATATKTQTITSVVADWTRRRKLRALVEEHNALKKTEAAGEKAKKRRKEIAAELLGELKAEGAESAEVSGTEIIKISRGTSVGYSSEVLINGFPAAHAAAYKATPWESVKTSG